MFRNQKKDLFTMDVIDDELKKNDINIDIETLSEHIQYILGNYRDCYNESVERQAVRLAAPVLRNVGRVEGGFIRNLCSWGAQRVLNLWDLM